MEEEIKSEFNNCSFSIEEDDQILPTLLTYCINYKLSPLDLASSWEAYYLSSQLTGSVVKNAHLDGFLLHLQNEAKEKLNKEEANVYSSNDIDILMHNGSGGPDEAIQNSPSSQNQRPIFDVSTPHTNGKSQSGKDLGASANRLTPFGQRTAKFSPHFVFNNALNGANELANQEINNSDEDEIIRRVRPGQKCSLSVISSQPQSGCRFMYDRTENRFNFLENRIRKSTGMFTRTGLYGELADATVASEEEIFAVGIIACDAEGHLNDKSVLLQCSAEHSCGQRVRLDLHNLTKFSLFPGQVVGIQGRNPSGHYFVALKVFDSLPIPNEIACPPAKKQARPIEDAPSTSSPSRVLSAIIASGPFTTSDNLLFEPLQELLAYARRREPQLLILMGPFVDSEHPNIKKGTVDRSFRDIFLIEIISRLQDFTQYMGSNTHVILLPSIRDAHHDFVFPQASFDLNLLEDSRYQVDDITSLANPSSFSANEIIFGCCTVDVLKQLSGEEISRNPPNELSDRIGILATHLLKQQSFYPLYPPAIGVPLDFSLAPEALKIPSFPDVLLLPSDLAPFIKVLSIGNENEEVIKTMCVNPGRLAKGIGGGTFLELHYNRQIEKTNASIIRI
ncbi:DNA polymerase alpha subunit B [Rhynchospora pubera]|uniref:DNA polymerase alpha subunit B n=1 Tax=Rhynchospora pubera TaxID=906938 RepID=A0AAV8FSV0_9POAL|nr:DNA polymerase alpha subunit B [Rhynchospora pubera]